MYQSLHEHSQWLTFLKKNVLFDDDEYEIIYKCFMMKTEIPASPAFIDIVSVCGIVKCRNFMNGFTNRIRIEYNKFF